MTKSNKLRASGALPFRLVLKLAFILTAMLAGTQAFAELDYPADVRSIVEKRCMVCHGCYDAPCQLKLDAYAGLQRGASKDKVYDGARLLGANMTRLFEDAHTTEEWRDKGFYTVMDEQPDKSTIVRMLELKRQHPLPEGELLPDSFDLSLDRDQQCAKPQEFDSFARDYPLWGMPYGLPGLHEEEHQVLSKWLRNGAPGQALPQPSKDQRDAVARWETFFNGSSAKQQLMSRYIYEHLFIGSLHFTDLPGDDTYYQLVRSHTPPGQPIDIIATRRPYDSPGTDKFFYRLMPQHLAVLDKRHMPYALNDKRMARWQSLFLDVEYEISALPSYEPAVASNPFVAFRDLPLDTRYRFMLDEAQFTIMGFIKGPVCRGQVALNVIDDHFWVVFIDPGKERGQRTAEFLARESSNLRLPQGDSGLLTTLVQWRRYSRDQLKFLQAKWEFVDARASEGDSRVDLDLIWDGGGDNDNASLTVFRHFDSASVVKGLLGRQPKTAWVIDYSLLERIHYLLVAGFDVYGNVGHQLETRLYMDFLRMEGEQNFLFLLPQDQRKQLRDFWYRGVGEHVKKYVVSETVAFDRDTDIYYEGDDPKGELLDLLRARQPGAQAPRYRVVEPALVSLQEFTGAPLRLMPEVAYLQVLRRDGSQDVYTLLHNSGFLNNAQLLQEEKRRVPAEDYLTVVRGIIGSYPNIFFQVPEKDLAAFTQGITGMEEEADYAALVTRYGVRRTAKWFWPVADRLQDWYQQDSPREAGLFDLNRYQNR